jgi:hypothetical protein
MPVPPQGTEAGWWIGFRGLAVRLGLASVEGK